MDSKEVGEKGKEGRGWEMLFLGSVQSVDFRQTEAQNLFVTHPCGAGAMTSISPPSMETGVVEKRPDSAPLVRTGSRHM